MASKSALCVTSPTLSPCQDVGLVSGGKLVLKIMISNRSLVWKLILSSLEKVTAIAFTRIKKILKGVSLLRGHENLIKRNMMLKSA